jgi:glycosyltransferase involved in cell wall biosynthesis
MNGQDSSTLWFRLQTGLGINMISVIIPTMWKGKQLQEMLPKVLDQETVGEVIIIDNAPKERSFDLPKSKKLVVIEQKENKFVNPAWNLGVKTAKNSKICIMSDDLVFDESIFNSLHDEITEKIGVIGLNPEGIKSFFVKSPLLQINPVETVEYWDGFGTLMFFHKKNYLPIPENLLIYWGDVWIYDYNAIQCRQNYMIDKFCVQTEMRTTSSMFKNITDIEESLHLDLFKKMYLDQVRQGKSLSGLMSEKVYELVREYA